MIWRRDPLYAGSDGECEFWDRRAVEYWALQCYKYGWLIDLENTQTVIHDDIVVSRALIAHVVPGERVKERAWREMNPPGKVIQQLGLVQ